jgi:hypothetical protein
MPKGPLVDEQCWTIYSFGTDTSLIIDSFWLRHPTATDNQCEDHYVFNRSFNDEGNTWDGAISNASFCLGDWVSFPPQVYPTKSRQHAALVIMMLTIYRQWEMGCPEKALLPNCNQQYLLPILVTPY